MARYDSLRLIQLGKYQTCNNDLTVPKINLQLYNWLWKFSSVLLLLCLFLIAPLLKVVYEWDLETQKCGNAITYSSNRRLETVHQIRLFLEMIQI